jgi:hypothetical protein
MFPQSRRQKRIVGKRVKSKEKQAWMQSRQKTGMFPGEYAVSLAGKYIPTGKSRMPQRLWEIYAGDPRNRPLPGRGFGNVPHTPINLLNITVPMPMRDWKSHLRRTAFTLMY